MTRIQRALESYRNKVAKNEGGFTLIELLVVVLIIGVLAAIAIPIYLNVQDTAQSNSVKSSVTEAKTAYVAYITNGGAAITTTSLAGISGYSAPGGSISLSFKAAPTISNFCIIGTDGNDAHKWYITNSTSISQTAC